MKQRHRLAIAITVLALGASACSGSSDASEANETTASTPVPTETTSADTSSTSEATTTSQVETTTTAETTTTTAETTTTEAEDEYVLALSPDGLLVVEKANGESSSLPFGSTQTIVVNAVTNLLGPPSELNDGFGECGNGQDAVAIWDDSIMLEFSQSTFIAWTLRTGSDLTDMAGVGQGTTLAALRDAWSISIEETTLGTEFATTSDGSGYGGILSDDTDSAVVDSLWSGPVCLFR